jgi:hypothetical protein
VLSVILPYHVLMTANDLLVVTPFHVNIDHMSVRFRQHLQILSAETLVGRNNTRARRAGGAHCTINEKALSPPGAFTAANGFALFT